jgi:peptide/nickel transport system permease protein
MADTSKSLTPMPAGPGAPIPDGAAILEVPLWQVRLRLAWRSAKTNIALFAENPIGLIGLSIIILFAIMAFIHPILLETVWDRNMYNPITGYDISIPFHPSPPSPTHWLGTDPLGRDVLSQLMFGTRTAFILGMVAALVTTLIGTSVGAVSAYYGGIVDTLFMRLADLIIMTPTSTILIVLGSLINLEMIHLAVIIGLLGGLGGVTIIIKSQALTIKVRTYIEAARVAGGGHGHIIIRHIIPNLLPLSFLYMMFSVTTAIGIEAVLSFFGLLNVRMSWGLMIYTTSFSGYLLDIAKWWLIFPASLAITFLCAAFYLVGRALDEVVNPRLRKR